MYKSRRVPFSLFVNIPLTTPRINFRISECHHRFSIDLIVIFSAKNGKLFLDHTDPLNHEEKWLNVIYKPPRRSRVVYIEYISRSAAEWFMIQINLILSDIKWLWDVKPDSEGFKVIIPWVKNGLFSTFSGFWLFPLKVICCPILQRSTRTITKTVLWAYPSNEFRWVVVQL